MNYDARKAGRDAYREWREHKYRSPAPSNPYSEFSVEWEAWEDGFEEESEENDQSQG